LKKTLRILELEQNICCKTPKGEGRVWLVTEYGTEIEKVFTVILNNGQVWEFTNKDILMGDNLTMGRGKWETKIT